MCLRNFFNLAVMVAVGGVALGQPVYTLHWQATAIPQGHPAFQAPYSSLNSVSPDQEGKVSYTATVFGGAELWTGGALYFNPEATMGTGISSARGLGGFANGETYRIGSSDFKLFIARLYLQQTIGCGGGRDTIADDMNQVRTTADARRLTITAGKFSVSDMFDDNAYSHDPRSQFMNWSLMSAGAWDYPADTRGYTIGAAAAYHDIDWSARAAIVMEPTTPNGLDLDTRLGIAHGISVEGEYRYQISGDSGTVRGMVFGNTSQSGSYREAIDMLRTFMRLQDYGLPDYCLSATRRDGRVKYGGGINIEQQLSRNVGAFLRANWNDGATETWAFTEIDRSLSVGAEFNGRSWGSVDDVGGAAVVFNGLSDDHKQFLELGGHGFMIGDGDGMHTTSLTYALETIFELYYRWKPLAWMALSPDYQFVLNPAYNADRGPIHILALRVHVGM